MEAVEGKRRRDDDDEDYAKDEKDGKDEDKDDDEEEEDRDLDRLCLGMQGLAALYWAYLFPPVAELLSARLFHRARTRDAPCRAHVLNAERYGRNQCGSHLTLPLPWCVQGSLVLFRLMQAVALTAAAAAMTDRRRRRASVTVLSSLACLVGATALAVDAGFMLLGAAGGHIRWSAAAGGALPALVVLAWMAVVAAARESAGEERAGESAGGAGGGGEAGLCAWWWRRAATTVTPVIRRASDSARAVRQVLGWVLCRLEVRMLVLGLVAVDLMFLLPPFAEAQVGAMFSAWIESIGGEGSVGGTAGGAESSLAGGVEIAGHGGLSAHAAAPLPPPVWLERCVTILMVSCGLARMPIAIALYAKGHTLLTRGGAAPRSGGGGKRSGEKVPEGGREGSREGGSAVVFAAGIVSYAAESVFFASSVVVGAARVNDVLVPVVVPLYLGWWVWQRRGTLVAGGGEGGTAAMMVVPVVAVAGLLPFLLFTRPAVHNEVPNVPS